MGPGGERRDLEAEAGHLAVGGEGGSARLSGAGGVAGGRSALALGAGIEAQQRWEMCLQAVWYYLAGTATVATPVGQSALVA